MNHAEMVELIRAGILAGPQTWADLGSGTGNFTWALANLLGAGSTIHALDRDARAIASQQARMRSEPLAAAILPRHADVLQGLSLPPLDGILMANLLHFVRDQAGLLRRLRSLLLPHGRLVIVEYEQATPIPWVPFPLSFAQLAPLAHASGLAAPTSIGRRISPSSGRVLYAAVLTTEGVADGLVE